MNESEKLRDVVDEYLHWRKVNPHIKVGESYLKRLRDALAGEQPLLEMAAEALKIAEMNFDADNMTTQGYLRRIQQTLRALQQHGYGKE